MEKATVKRLFLLPAVFLVFLSCYQPTQTEIRAAVEFREVAQKACSEMGGKAKTDRFKMNAEIGTAVGVEFYCVFSDTFMSQRSGGLVEAPE